MPLRRKLRNRRPHRRCITLERKRLGGVRRGILRLGIALDHAASRREETVAIFGDKPCCSRLCVGDNLFPYLHVC